MTQGELLLVGAERSPVLVFDEASGDPAALVETAAALSPYPAASNFYPGLRRLIGTGDVAAMAYVTRLLRSIGPRLCQTFGLTGFQLLEASFSMVTTPPERLSPPQRAPHFDSPDPDYLAVLHYLSATRGTGTAFYRQRSTGIEQVSAASLARFVEAAQRETTTASGYIHGSNAAFEQTGAVEAAPDRLIVYRGRLLHSGIIPPGATLETDPRKGRLTANLFVHGRRAGGLPRR